MEESIPTDGTIKCPHMHNDDLLKGVNSHTPTSVSCCAFKKSKKQDIIDRWISGIGHVNYVQKEDVTRLNNDIMKYCHYVVIFHCRFSHYMAFKPKSLLDWIAPSIHKLMS